MSKKNSTTSPHVNTTEQTAIAALVKFAKQRSGIDRRDYFSSWSDKEGVKAWRDELKSVSQDLQRFNEALSIAEAEGVTDEDFREQFEALNEELENLNRHARELQETIARNAAEILEA